MFFADVDFAQLLRREAMAGRFLREFSVVRFLQQVLPPEAHPLDEPAAWNRRGGSAVEACERTGEKEWPVGFGRTSSRKSLRQGRTRLAWKASLMYNMMCSGRG